jgi:predicted RNase H-like HicB family nuclease
MLPSHSIANASLHHWLVVRPEPAGQFTAQLLGLPELAATASSREEAIEQVRIVVEEWLASGQLVPLPHPLRAWPGHDPADPLEQEFLADLERSRQEDLERALRESSPEQQPCSNTSSIPTI